ncbi:MAG: DNA methyltransferase, partial [Christensenellaceae bacterium]
MSAGRSIFPLNRRCISTDINPIGSIIGKAKTTTLTSDVENELLRYIGKLESLVANMENLQIFVGNNKCELSGLVPEIPNLDKWFSQNAICELSLIKYMIATELEAIEGKTIAKASLSKIINKVSNQESETRYCAKEKDIQIGDTIRYYVSDLSSNLAKVKSLGKLLGFREAEFITADITQPIVGNGREIQENSIDLIVTSPPYPNAFDYHLYHRFRIFWLDGDPQEMGKHEIGSHLRYQKQKKGFKFFEDEMKLCLENCFLALKPDRYAALVLGDAIFDGQLYKTAELIGAVADKIGFTQVDIINRPLHDTKRSMQSGTRRAKEEQILIIKKPSKDVGITLFKAPYKLWSYEEAISKLELSALFPSMQKEKNSELMSISSLELDKLNRLTFYHGYSIDDGNYQPTWQSILENGDAAESIISRKDPKYITHGIHPYKGKFYPQLVKPLLNISQIPKGGVVFDPFCGSGTVALESCINGYQAIGCDVNPIAVDTAKAKNEILFVDPYLLDKQIDIFVQMLSAAVITAESRNVFDEATLSEMERWFPEPVIRKLGYLLERIRELSEPTIQNFLSVILSSIIRQVSQQEPTDLRIRKRKDLIEDAAVFELFISALKGQQQRLLKFAKTRHRAPNNMTVPKIHSGSCANATFLRQVFDSSKVDAVITSPPYATALPYIDTNRLSLLVLHGLTASKRNPIEAELTGTREITKKVRLHYEDLIRANEFDSITSPQAISLITKIFIENVDSDEIGFRKKNMAALLYMYFNDMSKTFNNLNGIVKDGGKLFIVIGDTKTTTSLSTVNITTTDILCETGQNLGWILQDRIPISVTTEDYKHMTNSITENTIICFQRPL